MAAGNHAASIEHSIEDMHGKGQLWVLAKMETRLTGKLPPGPLEVATWASRTRGARAYRDFRVRDGDGRVAGEAATSWLILDQKSRRPQRLTQGVIDLCVETQLLDWQLNEEAINAPDKAEAEWGHEVGWYDLDANGHVNNVRYIEWSLNAAMVRVDPEAELRAFLIHFLDEAHQGERVAASVCKEKGAVWLHAVRTAGGTALAVARSVWERR